MSKFTSGKWTYDDYGQIVFAEEEQMMVAEIRGWGHLTGKGIGSLGLSEAEAVEIQNANGRLIVAAPELYEIAQSVAKWKGDYIWDVVSKAKELLARIDYHEERENYSNEK